MFQPTTCQFKQHAGITLGRKQADGYIGRRLIAVFQLHHKALHAAVTASQIDGQITGHAPQRENQRTDILHLMRQLDAQVKHIRWAPRIQSGGKIAGEPIQRTQQLRAKAPAQSIPRQAQQLAKGADTHARQRFCRRARQVTFVHAHTLQCRTQRGRCQHRLAVADPGQHWRKPRALKSARNAASNRGHGPNKPMLRLISSTIACGSRHTSEL